jgi:hypothetical protein
MAATDGPTRAIPAKNSRIAPTVLTSASRPSQAQPAGPKPRSGPPVAIPPIAKGRRLLSGPGHQLRPGGLRVPPTGSSAAGTAPNGSVGGSA